VLEITISKKSKVVGNNYNMGPENLKVEGPIGAKKEQLEEEIQLKANNVHIVTR